MVLLAAVCIEQSSLEAFGERVAGAIARGLQAGGQVNTLRTVLGERKRIILADGSELVLNTRTQIQTAMRRESRNVTLVQGEAVLNVAEDPQRPLMLRMVDAELQTVGAKVLVRRDRDGSSSIHMLTGDGWLQPARPGDDATPTQACFQPVLFRGGQSVSMRQGVRIITSFDPARIDRALAWTHGEVWLLGETLSEAVAEFNRYNYQQLVVGDAAIENLRVGGRFDARDVGGFVNALRSTFGIRAVTVRSGGAGASTVVLVGVGHSGV